MGFRECLNTMAEAGDITRQEAELLADRYETIRKRKAKDSGSLAEQLARDELTQELHAERLEKRRHLALTVAAVKRLDQRFAAAKDINAEALDLLESFQKRSIEGKRKAIVGEVHGRIEALLYHFRRTKLLGNRGNKADLDNVVREAFGIDSKDAGAKALAQSWKEAHEWLRRRFNAAGGAIAQLENWGLPQMHDARALRKVGREAWKARIGPALDLSRMRSPLTGGALAPEELDGALDAAFDSITSEGWATREPSMAAFGTGKIANQHQDHRFLIFKDPDAWLAYQRDFGEGDPFAAMMAHVNRMARDIAAMEELGPNPSAMLEHIKQRLMKADAASGGDGSRKAVERIGEIWGAMRGTLETPVNQTFADVMATARSLVTSQIMGSALIVSVTGDLGTSAMARKFAGIGGSAGLDILKQFVPANRREAVASGLILENAMHTLHSQARYVGSFGGPEWARRLADRTMTWSGLTPWTQAARHAGGMAIMHELGVRAEQSFAELPGALQRTLHNWGLAEKWDALRRHQVYRGGNDVPFLRASDIGKHDQDLAEHYLEMINGEVEHMVPNGSVRISSFLKAGRPGTLWGELSRSFGQLKSFASLFMFLHWGKVAQRGGWRSASGAAYAGSLLITTTMAGAAALQLGSLASGRDPESVTDPRFWGAAALKGGGLGLFGDFLFNDVNRYGGGFGRVMQGPTTQHLWDLWTLTGGNVIETVTEGGPKHLGREFTQFLRSNTPGGSLWYARLAYERVVLDQLQHLVDPEANKAFKRRQQWWQKTRGQEFFWAPGDLTPMRAPDFSKMLGAGAPGMP